MKDLKPIHCILLIDDDLAGNAFHVITIKKSGVCSEVRTASNGRKALDYLLRSEEDPEKFPKPDLIFLDINMPGMNGFEFLDEYKKLDGRLSWHSIIIMLTTSLNPEDKERALSHPEVIGFQNKPLTKNDILATVEKHFQTQ